jgi:hypothetical protein
MSELSTSASFYPNGKLNKFLKALVQTRPKNQIKMHRFLVQIVLIFPFKILLMLAVIFGKGAIKGYFHKFFRFSCIF